MGLKEQHKLVLLRLCVAFLQLLTFLAGLCMLQLTVPKKENQEPLLAAPCCVISG